MASACYKQIKNLIKLFLKQYYHNAKLCLLKNVLSVKNAYMVGCSDFQQNDTYQIEIILGKIDYLEQQAKTFLKSKV